MSRISGDNVFDITADNCTGQTISPGQSCAYDVRIATTAGGTFNAFIRVTGTSGNVSVSDEAPVYGSVAMGPSSTFIEYQGWNRNFGQVSVGPTVAERTIQYMRTGGATLNVDSVISNSADFEVRSVLCTVNGVTDRPLPVQLVRSFSTGDQCFIRAGFNTQTVGSKSGQISISSNDADQSKTTIALSGEVVAPLSTVLNADGSAFNPSFGTLTAGSAPVDRNARVRPANAAPLTVSSMTVTGDFGSSLVSCMVGGQSASLPAVLVSTNDYCQVTVSQNPTTEGAKTGSLSVQSNGTNSPVQFSLSATVASAYAGPNYSSALGAYALRKVNPNYNGPAVRVGGVDIGFNAQGFISAADLSAYSGQAVSIWYNQSGGQNLTLAAGDGPVFASNSGKPALVFSSDTMWANALMPTSYSAAMDVFVSAAGNSSGLDTAAVSLHNGGGAAAAYLVLYTHESDGSLFGSRAFVRGNPVAREASISRAGRNVFTYSHAVGSASIRVDGTAVASGTGLNTSLSGPFLEVGGASLFSQYHNGSISEVLVFLTPTG